MKRIGGAALAVLLTMSIASCEGRARDAGDDQKGRLAEPAAVAKPVERGAVGDADLRVMLAELASTKACDLMRGRFRSVRAADRPDVVIGLMWIRDCRITRVGDKVTLALSGNGWQWAEQQQHKAGATFAIHQYVKFGMTAAIPGALDVAYDRQQHVVSLWFTPAQLPEVTFTPLGGVRVDEKGAWSSVVGALGTFFAESPTRQAETQTKAEGGHQLQKQLADGLSVTINLCTGLSRFGLGREPKGAMNEPDAGETKSVGIELQPNALMVFGPAKVGDAGFTANIDAATGPVHATLACRDQAETLAAAYVEGRALPAIETLTEKDILGKGSLRVGKAKCEVSLIAQPTPVPNAHAVTFDWERPSSEIAKAAGGAMIRCGKPGKKGVSVRER